MGAALQRVLFQDILRLYAAWRSMRYTEWNATTQKYIMEHVGRLCGDTHRDSRAVVTLCSILSKRASNQWLAGVDIDTLPLHCMNDMEQ